MKTKKKIITGLMAAGIASVAVAAGIGSFRTVELAPASTVTVDIDPIVVTNKTQATPEVEIGRTRIPGTLDTAEWGPWRPSGPSYGGQSTEVINVGFPTSDVVGGKPETRTRTDGDFEVTLSYTSERIETITTPRTKTTTTTALMQDETRECIVTINGVPDVVVPTCQ